MTEIRSQEEIPDKKHDIDRILDDQSLKASVEECAYASLMVGSGENFLAPYAIFLKATNFQLGLLSSLPLLLGAISQLIGVWLSELSPSRLKIILRCVLVQSLVWLPISVLYFFAGQSPQAVWLLILLYGAYFISGNLAAPAWSSLIGDLSPADIRGRFFGLRNEKSSIVMLLTLIGAGALLEVFTWLGYRGFGFLLLFFCAFAGRMVSLHYLSLHRDPHYIVEAHAKFSYYKFLKRSFKSNFARFVYFVSAISFSVMIAGPFFAPYMLNVLGFSYFTYSLMTVTTLATMFLTARYWGKLADKYGNKSILRLCAIGVTINPLLYLVWSSVVGCLFISAFAGIVWAGYNLAVSNFLFDAVTPPKRSRCVAYQAITNAVFLFAGSLFGAWLLNVLPSWFPFHHGIWTPDSAYLQIFFISVIFRAVACYFLLSTFREVREVASIRQTELFIKFISVLPYVGSSIDYFFGRRSRERKALGKSSSGTPTTS
ncbi:MAG: MFS transporter [SAR324 cluster bacterium]|uniref:MFS transporter n=1 Tax=SAR324 cluster bacterium TaxID=2024889 RepID=A0A7X9FV08_9DELT|nr:MFS transporter [SAR324 cluster bacterium]